MATTRILAVGLGLLALTACAADPVSGRSTYQPAMMPLLELR